MRWSRVAVVLGAMFIANVMVCSEAKDPGFTLIGHWHWLKLIVGATFTFIAIRVMRANSE